MDGSRNYLDQAHTVRYLRAGELLVTRLAERGNWDEWDRRGLMDMVRRAQQRVDKLLSEADPLPLEAAQERELDRILNHALQTLPTL